LKKGPNPSYWVAKIARNRERDREHRMQLRMMGWRVLRFWASDILNDHEHIAERIFAILGK
jgi:DNA mismatch endonuclease (patch repair protein)